MSDAISEKYNMFSEEMDKAYRYYSKLESVALRKYYRHMYHHSDVYFEEYMREINHAVSEYRHKLEELRGKYKEILTEE